MIVLAVIPSVSVLAVAARAAAFGFTHGMFTALGIVVAGSARFRIGEAEESRCSTGDVVHVESNTPHGFRTTDQSLVVYYLWQAGDLRQISSFG